MVNKNSSFHPNKQKQWETFYYQTLTRDGKEVIMNDDGTKQLILLPMLTYILLSTMIQKLKYLPRECFNRIIIDETPICGLRSVDKNSSTLMSKITDILRVIIDGIRQQQIQCITMIFHQKTNIDNIYDAYSIVLDYSEKLTDEHSKTPIEMIARMIHQIEYMFDWNDPFPNDVELTFVISALDQFENDQAKIPSPFGLVCATLKKAYLDHETNHLLGRLMTPNGKIWLKFLPHRRQHSGSTMNSEDLSTNTNTFDKSDKRSDTKKPNKSKEATTMNKASDNTAMILSPKLKKKTKRTIVTIESSKTGTNVSSLNTSLPSKTKKRHGLLAAVKSLITPLRTPAPLTSSTPNPDDLVLIRHTSTPKPGETASRIIIGGSNESAPLSAIHEVCTPGIRSETHSSSLTPSTFTTTDISTALTPTLTVDRRTTERPPTVRGQAAEARKKIAAMQIRDNPENSSTEDDDDDDDDNEQFDKLFNRRKSKKIPKPKIVLLKTTSPFSDISSISSTTSNLEFILTPPTARKRLTSDRTDADDLSIEHGTPPKTPRTARRNRILESSTSVQRTPMDIGDIAVTVDSPRLLRSVTKKLQLQASARKPTASNEQSIITLDESKSQESLDREREMKLAYVRLDRSSVALHYSMEDSD